MWKLEQWSEYIGNCNSFFCFLNEKQKTCVCDAVKEVVEECLKCKCQIPQEILNRLTEESLQKKHEAEMLQLQHIVQAFQELTENMNIKSLLEECAQIAIHCDHQSDQPLDNDEKSDISNTITKQTQIFRIYAFVVQDDQPAISFCNDKQKRHLQRIGGNIFVGDFQVEVDSPVLFQYNNMWYTTEDNCKVYVLRLPREKVPITSEIVVFKHLVDSIKDWPSLEFTLQAKNNLSTLIERHYLNCATFWKGSKRIREIDY
ncbi:hypothetical protein RFI_16785 [Reticulomyxa filosa]|uniref:Uncharacterized protein n=1 Tax=Reticulomyxa filosa TaxID=46433 RepID=X6N3X1_RETFI|nr:hypothetical protein RFI_16785 [Reticulomyxa filosa]|eukprot:ETO20434.1 hypothetical protein RFI_16785 [Reticulomyxa filosa]